MIVISVCRVQLKDGIIYAPMQTDKSSNLQTGGAPYQE